MVLPVAPEVMQKALGILGAPNVTECRTRFLKMTTFLDAKIARASNRAAIEEAANEPDAQAMFVQAALGAMRSASPVKHEVLADRACRGVASTENGGFSKS
jgi:hypothetical protein